MRTIILFISILLISSQTYSQATERLWEQGKLTWDDFKGEPFSTSPNDSELNYNLSYNTVKKKVGDSVFLVFETKNFINPGLSWVKGTAKTAELLTYNQTLFDIIELHRRRLQQELHRIQGIYIAEDKFRTHNYACSREIRKFQNETNFGTDKPALEYWRNRIERQLQQNPFESVPETIDRNFGYGLNAGFGSGIFTNTLADHFTPTFNFIFGFDIAYKHTALFLNFTLASNKVRSRFADEMAIWPDGLKSNVAIIDISLGQTLVDKAKSKITPFLGFGILEFSAAKDSEEYADHRKVNYGLIYGVNYDYKFRTAVRLTPTFGNYRDKVENLIRFKLYATSGNFNNMKGVSINFTIGYSVFGRLIRIK